MASLLQPRLENPKPLSHTAEPYNPTLTTKPNSLLPPYQLYQQPPPPLPSPSVMVMGMPVEREVWGYLNGHLYQHVYHHHHHYYQFPPLLPKLEYADFEVYNPHFLLHPQSQPIKPSGFAMKSSVVLEEVIDGDVKVPTEKKLGWKIGGSGGGAVGEMMKKVEKKYCVKRAASKNQQGVWLPKKIDGHKPTSVQVNDHHVFSQGETTLMMRNIPNKLRRDELLEILDQHCREENDKAKNRPGHVRSAYDFVYLPIDFKRLGNLGYAFINMTSREAAEKLRKTMNRCKWDAHLESKKQCGFSVARIQGRRALVNHFESSKFPTSTDSFLPVVLLPPHDGSYPCSTPRVVGNCV